MHELAIYCTANLGAFDKISGVINSIGGKIFELVVNGSYWFFVIVTITDIVKKGKDHDYMGCLKTALAGALGFASVKITRHAMDVIKEAL